ncbi:ATP-binding protein [Phycobacter sp. K97]|uniref:ATP-binding protein n=1 Tax=Phycobacter sedimenti TaxID=3133977 RepID=UPI00311F6439
MKRNPKSSFPKRGTVAEMKAAFERERSAREEAEAANNAKSAFLAVMSHEIRTPLNGVLGMAEALAESGLRDDQVQILDRITRSGNLLLTIVNDILDLSKIEACKLELEWLPTNVNETFMSLCEEFRPRIEAKGLSFTTVLSDLMVKGEVWAHLDPSRLRQVLGNLLSNALKFTTEGAVTFSVSAAPLDEETIALDFRVRDTGTGIHETQHGKLFNPFTQAEASVNRRHGGTGLGLVVAQQICKEMGGGIEFTSAEGDGSEFHVSLILELAQPPTATPMEDSDWSSDVLHSRRWRILVAEDNLTNQMVLRHQLKEFDLDLVILPDGAELYEIWLVGGADLILMDINMPVMDGVAATGKIRATEKKAGLASTPIIAISANAMLHQVQGYIARGMSDHVAKPTRKRDLIAIMARALNAASRREDHPEAIL